MLTPSRSIAAAPRGERLADRLERARNAGAVLAKSTDDLNRKIAAVEKALCALGLGVSVLVEITLGESPPERAQLQFRKWGNDWGLYVHRGGKMVALQNTSRDLRLIAVDHLKDLIDALIEKIDENARHVQERVTKLDDLIEELGEIGA
jgi:hypothetical protein